MFRVLFSLTVLTVLLAGPSDAVAQSAPGRTSVAAKSSITVNINTASASDFEALPGIGAKTAARIVEFRQKNGPFKKVEDLMNIRGIGEKNFLKLRAQLTVAPQRTEHGSQER